MKAEFDIAVLLLWWDKLQSEGGNNYEWPLVLAGFHASESSGRVERQEWVASCESSLIEAGGEGTG